MKAPILALFLVILATLSPDCCEGYRILGVFPFQARSHFMMYGALMKGLARKGHQVDVVSPFPLKNSYPNYTDIFEVPVTTSALVNNMTYEFFKTDLSDVANFAAKPIGNEICKMLGHPEMLKIIRSPHNPPYDVVLTEVFGTHCFMALGHHFKVPVIGVCSAVLWPWGHEMIGNPANLAFVPSNLVQFIPPMTFFERLYNTVYAVWNNVRFQHYTTVQNEMIERYLGKDAPTVREAERSLALILTNSHPVLNGVNPVTPGLIEVAGLHVQDDDSKLPSDLKKWMDDSTSGFIYFTFGSMVNIDSFSEEIIRIFYKSLDKIAPVRILLKAPNPKKLPSGLPGNFRTFQWVAQLKVLQHKNIKAFITHGGLMGTQEAIHCAVPMIGIPLFADQFINVDLYTARKIAIRLDLDSMTEKSFDQALKEILYNPLYKNEMKKFSAKFLDRPMSAMDTAIWWVEYIVRRGSNALRSQAMDLHWWQIELLDVYAFILLTAAITVILATGLVKFLINISGILVGPKVDGLKKSQ